MFGPEEILLEVDRYGNRNEVFVYNEKSVTFFQKGKCYIVIFILLHCTQRRYKQLGYLYQRWA